MAADIDAVGVCSHIGRTLWQLLEGQRTRKHGAWQVALLEHLHDPPEAHARAVLKERLGPATKWRYHVVQ